MRKRRERGREREKEREKERENERKRERERAAKTTMANVRGLGDLNRQDDSDDGRDDSNDYYAGGEKRYVGRK